MSSIFAVGVWLQMKRYRIAVINTHPIQYYAPFYAYLNASGEFDITALYLSNVGIRSEIDQGFGQSVQWDIDLLSGYQSKFVGRTAFTRIPLGFFSTIEPGIWKEVRSGDYDALILHGHNVAANTIAYIAAKFTGTAVFVRSDTNSAIALRGWRGIFRRIVQAPYYHACDRCLAVGAANMDFYRAIGIPPRKIFLLPFSVDNDRFLKGASLSSEERVAARVRFGIPQLIPAILFSAKFTRRKRPGDLLEAARRLRSLTDKPFTVVMSGSGEMEPELRSFCAANALDNVVFTGFVNQGELPRLYGACDVFVLPSETEPWGLAVNEAMCASLPIIVSREAGCAADLVSDGVNGVTLAVGQVDRMAETLMALIEDPELRSAQGAASLARISRWGFRECLEGLRAAMSSIATRKPIRTHPSLGG
jgi:glycosyltransferase involved in cell wall biosynthesis